MARTLDTERYEPSSSSASTVSPSSNSFPDSSTGLATRRPRRATARTSLERDLLDLLEGEDGYEDVYGPSSKHHQQNRTKGRRERTRGDKAEDLEEDGTEDNDDDADYVAATESDDDEDEEDTDDIDAEALYVSSKKASNNKGRKASQERGRGRVVREASNRTTRKPETSSEAKPMYGCNRSESEETKSIYSTPGNEADSPDITFSSHAALLREISNNNLTMSCQSVFPNTTLNALPPVPFADIDNVPMEALGVSHERISDIEKILDIDNLNYIGVTNNLPSILKHVPRNMNPLINHELSTSPSHISADSVNAPWTAFVPSGPLPRFQIHKRHDRAKTKDGKFPNHNRILTLPRGTVVTLQCHAPQIPFEGM